MRWWCETGSTVPVKGFGVQCLESRCLSADLVFRIWERLRVSANLFLLAWKRCACQRIWCAHSGNLGPANKFIAPTLDILCASKDFVLSVKKRYVCQRICFKISKRCGSQQIWCCEAGNSIAVKVFNVQWVEPASNLGSTVLQDPQDEKNENYCPDKYPCTLELCPCIEIGVDKNKDETQIW